jgi:hypothetical protein
MGRAEVRWTVGGRRRCGGPYAVGGDRWTVVGCRLGLASQSVGGGSMEPIGSSNLSDHGLPTTGHSPPPMPTRSVTLNLTTLPASRIMVASHTGG